MSYGILSNDRGVEHDEPVTDTQSTIHERIAHTVGSIIYDSTETASILSGYGVKAITNSIVKFAHTIFNKR